MENYIRCPACDSTRIRERHIGKKTGAVAGAKASATLSIIMVDMEIKTKGKLK
ncbi:hypothetical protein [Providencia vermicola]|uniref:hypothetical protein n=1 Tax=Providencia vermicola TaxID=333965 RepID=UPI0034DD007E